ncbi:MAG: UDP-3-O-(3-hydroxymyristoyl)glucosamine N-acyltransferase [Gemmatales bacterium]|nr:UDP-3-O-(3-hydroxymyristoyl)glucosamine N-acyltransferase [Gemmatales bacterium]MDW8385950.1 UDP-3-O-(3-hydroxymyristoyl)glucosamine N-acyltransferase [Gemmatales bacterium]
MPYTVRELAELVHGRIIGDDRILISSARPLSEAGPGDITFVADDKNAKLLPKCQASAVVTQPGRDCNGHTVIEVPDPLTAFLTIFERLHGRPKRLPVGIDPRACIAPSVRLGEGVVIGPGAVVGENSILGPRCHIHANVVIGSHCTIGEDVIIHPNVVLYDGCTVGNRVVIHAGAVIGKDGFGFRQLHGQHMRIPQLGSVLIEDDVEIGAGTTIDRGTFQATRIGTGTKIDNQVQIGHNCRIGRHNLIVSQVGVAGSTTTGDYVVIAGQAGIADHLTIGNGVVIGAQAGVMTNIPDGQRWLGTPARPEREAKVRYFQVERLPQVLEDLKRIKEALGLTQA